MVKDSPDLLGGLALPGESVARLADIILSLQRCFVAQLSVVLEDGEVSFVQFFLLSHINAHGCLSMSEIAEKMRHTTAAATGLVDRLERLGYLQRAADPADRRKVLVRICPKGAELVSRIREDMIQNLSKVMCHLDPHEQQMWLCIYEKVFDYCQNQAASVMPAAD